LDVGRTPLGLSRAPIWATAHARAKRERHRRGHGSGPRCWALHYVELGRVRETGGGKGETGHQRPKAGRAHRKRKNKNGLALVAGLERREREKKPLKEKPFHF